MSIIEEKFKKQMYPVHFHLLSSFSGFTSQPFSKDIWTRIHKDYPPNLNEKLLLVYNDFDILSDLELKINFYSLPSYHKNIRQPIKQTSIILNKNVLSKEEQYKFESYIKDIQTKVARQVLEEEMNYEFLAKIEAKRLKMFSK